MDKEKKNMLSCEACCGDHTCFRGTYGGAWFAVVRWSLLVIILLITFLFGVKMGELKSGAWGYGYRGMGPGMMDDYYYGKYQKYPPMYQQGFQALPGQNNN